jgi:hypothetical protein
MFTQARALTDLTTVQKARTKPAQWLEVLARQTAAEWIGEG